MFTIEPIVPKKSPAIDSVVSRILLTIHLVVYTSSCFVYNWAYCLSILFTIHWLVYYLRWLVDNWVCCLQDIINSSSNCKVYKLACLQLSLLFLETTNNPPYCMLPWFTCLQLVLLSTRDLSQFILLCKI